MSDRDARLQQAIAASGHSFDGPIVGGGDYAPVLEDGDIAYVSGQVPRVGNHVVVTGRVGEATSLQDAQLAARICVIRALLLLQRQRQPGSHRARAARRRVRAVGRGLHAAQRGGRRGVGTAQAGLR